MTNKMNVADTERLNVLRGLEIARRRQLTRDGDVWRVPTEGSRSFFHRVKLDPPHCICTCPEFADTFRSCRHIHAARFAEQRERGEALPTPDYPDIVPPGSPAWVTPELIRETICVWQMYYPVLLTPLDALALLLAIGRLTEI